MKLDLGRIRLPSMPWLARLPGMSRVDWNVWRPRAGYAAFALLAFAVALRGTFPSEAVRERLILEAGARGWQFEADDLGPGGLLGVTAEGVRLEDHASHQLAIDRVSASLRLLPLLMGRQVMDVDALVYEGRVRGSTALNGAERRTVLALEGLDLARAVPLKVATGMDLQGSVSGSVDVTVPEAPAGRPTGHMELAVARAGVAGGQLPIPGMATGLRLPRVGLGEIAASVKLEGGKAAVERLEAKGGDVELATDGLAVTLGPRLEHAAVFGKATVRIQPAFWGASATAGLRPIVEAALASARTPDGAYRLQVVGTLGHPRIVLTPGQGLPARGGGGEE
ncbi:type II secretion system protein GspN [Anaeromyxobacter dehalogenans]|uniref:Type II secretion system protein GspN n=1 Tax=Anaeromyxobacter dehalogenans (strain 2CP-C) TaxID=290397 RepID=Q2INS3_ANADE|nr:type II secretion system protein GspN [Anaeromyxobacter dehalogenans]ABC80452.1 hypothetical protein Adeh_0676 [Anaeromyxobacter dehalogenans 2CP-C]